MHNEFKIGDIVVSNWNAYGVTIPGVIDRFYYRGTNLKYPYCRLVLPDGKRINVTVDSCQYSVEHQREKKLTKLLGNDK